MNTEHFFSPFPELNIDDIILREIQDSDAPEYFEYMNHPEMKGFLTKDSIPTSIEKSVEEMRYWSGLFRSKRSIYWAIALKKNNKMIGTAGFNVISFSNSKAEISYDLDPNYWGQGVMNKSINAILLFAYHALELVRVQATVITDNKRSISLLDRLGFEQEGLLKKFEFVDGEHKDYYMYGRTQ